MIESRQDVVANGLRHLVHRFSPRVDRRSSEPELDVGALTLRGSASRAPGGEPEASERPRTLLFIHGFLDAGATVELLAKPLVDAGFEVIAPDLRGFGGSDRVPAGAYYHFADYVADIDDLVDTLVPAGGGEKPWLGVIGHSMGGTVATMWAGTRPERVTKLAILEGLGALQEDPALAVDRMRGWLRDLGRVRRENRSFESVEEAVTRLQSTHPKIERARLASRAARLVTPSPGGGVRWAHDPLHRTLSPIPFQVRVYESYLRAITCPTLFVDGGPEGWRPPDEAERLACIANLTKRSLPTAGHMMHWTQPDELAAELLSFFG